MRNVDINREIAFKITEMLFKNTNEKDLRSNLEVFSKEYKDMIINIIKYLEEDDIKKGRTQISA